VYYVLEDAPVSAIKTDDLAIENGILDALVG